MDGPDMSKTDAAKIGAVVAVIGLILYSALRKGSPYPVETGEYAPDFTLPGLQPGSPSQDSIHLFDHRGKVVLVNFWATWCPPCIEETPSLEKLSTDLNPLGVEVIGVSVDQDASALKKFVSDYHISFPVARDPDQTMAVLYGTFKFPETYILDRDGRVVQKIVGPRDWQDPQMVSLVEKLARSGSQTGK
jgi:cytochrome c biogenesis protein CcmG/thiol:disulfide interchange protein DsbE